MKKSQTVILGGLFTVAVIAGSCRQEPQNEWLTSKERADTVVNRQPYRYYGGFWYPLIAGRFNPGLYNGFSSYEMRHSASVVRPSMRSASGVRSGGFGSSSHSSHIGG